MAVYRRHRQWDNVLFSDETKLKVDSNDKRQHIYRRNGESFQDACVREVDRWGRTSVMIWTGTSYHGKTNLVFVNHGVGRGGRRVRDRRLTAQHYVDDVLHPVAVFLSTSVPMHHLAT